MQYESFGKTVDDPRDPREQALNWIENQDVDVVGISEVGGSNVVGLSAVTVWYEDE